MATHRKAALPKDLKRTNRSEILKIFQKSNKEEWSLAEISDAAGISRATVTKAVTAFVQKGVLICKGKGSSTEIGGKRPDLYAFNREYQFLAYLNIGIGWLTMAVLDLKLQEREAVRRDLPLTATLEELLAVCRECYREVTERAAISDDRIYGLCISTSGMVEQETGRVRHNLSYSCWGSGFPMKEIFEREFPNLVIKVENVARAAGRAELHYDQEWEKKKVFTVFTHRGISGCLIDHGKVQNSKNSLIGEIGHMIICPEDEEVCRCRSRGCFENMVVEERMVRLAEADPQRLAGSMMSGHEPLSLELILHCAGQGDPYACELTDRAAWYFSLAFRNIILTVDPEVIVIQGKYAGGGTYFVDRIREYMYNEAYFPHISDWEILCDNRDIWNLAKIGLSSAMADELFENRELYKD